MLLDLTFHSKGGPEFVEHFQALPGQFKHNEGTHNSSQFPGGEEFRLDVDLRSGKPSPFIGPVHVSLEALQQIIVFWPTEMCLKMFH